MPQSKASLRLVQPKTQVDYKSDRELIAAGLVLQALVEGLVVGIVATVYIRAARACMIPQRADTLHHAVRYINSCSATLHLPCCRSIRYAR